MMRFISAMQTAVSIGLVSMLTACGGGGGGGGGNPAPETIAQPNSLVVLSKGESRLQATTYALAAGNTLAGEGNSNLPSIGNLVLVMIETNAFETFLTYSRNDSRKYIVGLFDEAGKAYGCRSAAFTNAELQALVDTVDGGDVIAGFPVCNKTVTIDQTGRQANYANLKMPADNGSRDSITLSANFTWPVPLTDN